MANITKHFIRKDGAGVVDGALTVTRDEADPIWSTLPSELIDVTTHPDWRGDGSMLGGSYAGGTFTPPAPAPQMLSKAVFIGLLSDAEFAAMFMPATPTIPHAKALAQWAAAATPFSLHDPLVAGLLAFAEGAGFITSLRKAAIVAAMHAAAK